jgi:putative ABC transport system substrate-binding protein
MKELVRRKADVLIASGTEIALKSAVAATDKLPIVMIAIDYDPLALHYIANLARPGGNVTGVFFQQVELAMKRLQLMRDGLPSVEAATVFWDANFSRAMAGDSARWNDAWTASCRNRIKREALRL